MFYLFIITLYTLCFFNYSKENQDIKDNELNFIVIGDHGTGDINQKDVGNGMINYFEQISPKEPNFIISTGDVIYPDGLREDNDIRNQQLLTRFETHYKDPRLHIPWLITLGNHDCQGYIPAYLNYATNPLSSWYFPSRYYLKKYPIDDETIVYIIVLDTCDLVCGDLKNDDISLLNYNNRCIEGKIMDQVSNQTKLEQLYWLEETLIAIDNEKNCKYKWKLVVGHWSIYSHFQNKNTKELISILDPLLIKYKIHVYFSGHDHVLQHIVKKNNNNEWQPHYIVSGAGGMKYNSKKKNMQAYTDLVHYSLDLGFITCRIKKNSFEILLHNASGDTLSRFSIENGIADQFFAANHSDPPKNGSNSIFFYSLSSIFLPIFIFYAFTLR